MFFFSSSDVGDGGALLFDPVMTDPSRTLLRNSPGNKSYCDISAAVLMILGAPKLLYTNMGSG